MSSLAEPPEWDEMDALRAEVAGLRAEAKGLRAEVATMDLMLRTIAARSGMAGQMSAQEKAAVRWNLPQGA